MMPGEGEEEKERDEEERKKEVKDRQEQKEECDKGILYVCPEEKVFLYFVGYLKSWCPYTREKSCETYCKGEKRIKILPLYANCRRDSVKRFLTSIF
jgi:hypothetical protein